MSVKLSDSGLWRTLSPGSYVRALIVDDNPSDRDIYRRFLESDKKRKYDVLEAGSAKAAIEVLADDNIQCVLLDYKLPDMSGIEFLEYLQSTTDTSMIPVIVVTGQGDENLAVRCLRKGAVDYVPKDKVSPGVFHRAIGNAIVQADMRSTIEQQTKSLTKANHELRTRNEEIKRFYHAVSHEIKTPLTATREFIAIVLDELVGELNSEQKEVLSHALDSCDDIATQFNDLVDCTRLETGKLRLRKSPCTIEGIIQRSFVAVSPTLRGSQITVKQKVQSGLPEVEIDGVRMVRVVSNLLTNAIQHSKAGDTIRIYGRRLDDAFVIGIRDTGCGIPAEHLQRIFDRLYQVAEDTDELFAEGLGLGLTIAREIVNLHGGDLLVESEVGKGSTFIIKLPDSIEIHEDAIEVHST